MWATGDRVRPPTKPHDPERLLLTFRIRSRAMKPGVDDERTRPVRRATLDAAELPQLRRRRGDPLHPQGLEAGMEHDAGRPAAARGAGRRPEGRHPRPWRAGGVWRPGAR